MSIRQSIEKLERRFPRLSRAVYDRAVQRHFDRLSAVVEHYAGDAMRLFSGGEKPPKPPTWDGVDAWKRDQAIIDDFHRRHFGEQDGKRLNAYGLNPRQMFDHFCAKGLKPDSD